MGVLPRDFSEERIKRVGLQKTKTSCSPWEVNRTPIDLVGQYDLSTLIDKSTAGHGSFDANVQKLVRIDRKDVIREHDEVGVVAGQ